MSDAFAAEIKKLLHAKLSSRTWTEDEADALWDALTDAMDNEFLALVTVEKNHNQEPE